MDFKKVLIPFFNRISEVKELRQQKADLEKNSLFPPGHFYSPVVSVEEIEKRQAQIWTDIHPESLEGIDLNVSRQLDIVKELEKFYLQMPFAETKKEGLRFYFDNEYYSYTDAFFLYGVLRHFKPKKIIEIGSGFSSAIMLDTNDHFLNNSVDFTFVEPYPGRLKSLLREQDKTATKLIEENVQQVKMEVFEQLNAGDILFVDSTHVVKTGSDVNFILFEILPKLKSGVLIHFHDIFYPFEYPKQWVLQGRNWNEAYALRAFFMYNSQFHIQLFSDYLHKHHHEVFKNMPLCYKNSGGNLWLVKD
jgi:predicted O-methyltransferase YrrM